MATQSPFSFVEGILDQVATRFAPPSWAVREVQQRTVLLLNHVLQQEPEAMARLKRQQGQVVLVQWRAVNLPFSLRLATTPAGLVELAAVDTKADLTLTVVDASPMTIVQKTARGQKPEVRIEGDVQLAAEINWLVDHLRWDIEEDLSKIVGDVMAHQLGEVGRGLATALRTFMTLAPKPGSSVTIGRKASP